MSLSEGARLGPYEILAKLGEGGMGQVFKARDTRLDRIVAIKVLPAEWAADPAARQRFDREAQTIASLKHPHICVLHDIGSVPADEAGLPAASGSLDYLVMEHLEGETLSDRLKKGPLPLDEALGIAIAIGDALDKAHRQGVVHRDVKPSNVMLTPTGPKLLDFGLAKSQAAMPAATSVTMPGTILGTMQYMAPEQLDGVEADRRTDIFSFGVVIHEMVTGKKAFEGKSQVLLISAIATSEPPPISLVMPEAPATLDHLVKTCLAKDPADRWQDARDLVAELRWIAENGGDAGLGVASGPGGRGWGLRVWLRRAALAAAAAAIAALAWPATLYLQGPPEPEELRFRVPRQLTAQTAETQGGNSMSGGQASFNRADTAISPDGRWIAFVARASASDTYMLYVRPVGAVTPQRLAGTENASLPFWSDDSQFIAFVGPGGKLRKMKVAGGAPQDLAMVPGFTGGTWSGGTMLYGSDAGIFRLSAEGGAPPEPVTTLGQSEGGHFWPRFLPDGRHFVCFVKGGDAAKSGVFAGSLDSKELRQVVSSDTSGVFVDSGHLVFQRGAAVFAQRFDPSTLATNGEPVRLADDVLSELQTGHGLFDASRNGVLVYFASSQGGTTSGEEAWEFQMQWVNRSGQVTESVGPRGVYRGVELSPDGKRVAVHRHDGTGGDIWVMEPPPRNPTRITFDATMHNSSPVWSPGGDRIVFASHRNNKWGLYVTQSDGSGTDGELLIESELPTAPLSWSPDGKRLVYWVHDPKTLGDLWILPFDGDKKPVPFLASSKNETHAQISPDGKWIAYTSELTGRKEVYVQPFPTGTGRWQISPDAGLGGDWPRWRRDSQELYYHSLGNAGAYGIYTNALVILGPMYSASIKATGGSIEAGTPVEVLRFAALRIPHPGADYHTYAVAGDGQRVLVFQRALTGGTASSQIGPEFPVQGLTVAMNLKALRPR